MFLFLLVKYFYRKCPICTFLNALKWLVTQKFDFFCRVSPISTRLFWNITCTFKRPSLRLFRFKIWQFVPFFHRFCGFLFKRGTNCEILNLNNRRLVLLKVYVKLQKVLYWLGKPILRIFIFEWPVTSRYCIHLGVMLFRCGDLILFRLPTKNVNICPPLFFPKLSP